MLRWKWLRNTYDPKREGPDPEKEAWLEGKFIGFPKATEVCSVRELLDMHIIGVYVEENDD